MKKRITIVAVVLLLVSGCVSWKSAALVPEGDDATIRFWATGKGMLVDHSGAHWGSATDDIGGIKLHGRRKIYNPGEFEIFDQFGSVGLDRIRGQITLDRQTRLLTVRIKLDGKSFYLNGSYRLKMPNQAPEPTTTLVTPRAGARVAPSAVVAHL